MRNERAARYSDLFAARREEPSDCDYCPWCTTIAVVRRTKPEVLEHLAVAAREMIAAAGVLVQEAAGRMEDVRHHGWDEPPDNVVRFDGTSIS